MINLRLKEVVNHWCAKNSKKLPGIILIQKVCLQLVTKGVIICYTFYVINFINIPNKYLSPSGPVSYFTPVFLSSERTCCLFR